MRACTDVPELPYFIPRKARKRGNLRLPESLKSNRKLPEGDRPMIRKLKSGQYRLYSRRKDPKTGRRRNLGTFKSRAAAEKHERAVQYFKHH